MIIVLAITFQRYLEFAAVGNILFYLCSKSSSLQLSLELGNALTVDKRLIALYSSVHCSAEKSWSAADNNMKRGVTFTTGEMNKKNLSKEG